MEKTDRGSASAVDELTDEGQGEWIVTYADLVTLLLVFFVLLFSISSLNLEKFKYALKSIQVSLGESDPAVGLLELLSAPETDDQKISIEDVTGLRSREKDMLSDINQFIRHKELSENIVLISAEGKIMLRIRGAVLFASGSAAMNPSAMPILNEIKQIIDDYPEYSVNIKGHTDDQPIVTPEFPSNWELSSIRATNVLKFLIVGGVDPERLTATGYADLMPLVPNTSEENRARNRRVEFVLEKKTSPF